MEREQHTRWSPEDHQHLKRRTRHAHGGGGGGELVGGGTAGRRQCGSRVSGVSVSALTLKTGPVECGLTVALALRRTVQRWEWKADFGG